MSNVEDDLFSDSARKRRRITDEQDDNEDEDSVDDNNEDNISTTGNNNNNNNNNNTLEDEMSEDDNNIASARSRRRRRQRVEELAAERRRQRRLRQEVAELHDGDADLQPATTASNRNNRRGNDEDVDNEELDQDFDYEEINDIDGVEDDGNVYQDPEEEEEGEDLMENAERDYQRIEALDTYGREGIDDREYDAMDVDQRRAAEAVLRARDRQSGGRGRDAGIYGMALDDMEADEDEEARKARRNMFRRGGPEGEEEDHNIEDQEDEGLEDDIDEEELDGEDPINLEAFDVPLQEWLAQGRTKREVQRKFRAFLRHFQPETAGEDFQRRKRANGIYEQKIRRMCAANLSSLQISYNHLMEAEPLLAVWLADAPWDMLQLLDVAVTNHTIMLFPSYKEIKNHVHVRISDIPIMDSLRDLRRTHLEHLVKVHGVVTRRGSVYPLLLLPVYKCFNRECGAVIPMENDVDRVGKDSGHRNGPEQCPYCEGKDFRFDNMKSSYGNVQRINLQESPGSVPPGRVPRQKEVFLTDDLIDSVRPGEEIEVTGIFQQQHDFSLSLKSGFPVFSTNLLANHIRKREDASSASNMTEGDVRKILELSRDPKIADRIVQSIAPSIFGHDNCKMALAMSLFGGVPKNIKDKHRIRGDINVLLLGDPGTAKSQLLKYAEATAPRAVYSTGKGASAVGLTAGVHKDPVTKEWTLEGGALVLADQGVALIDEFDKMNEQDRTSIHEAMEQQSISVSKAGIVTSLQARCSVIAAANPIGGRYDSSNTLCDNVELTDPILQRFDILCVLQDTVDPVYDERLASFVTSSHMNAIPTRDLNNGVAVLPPSNSLVHKPGIIEQGLLRKYIQYARTNIKPDLRGNAFDQEKVASLYVALRKESAKSGGVPIAVRHIESIMRMAEAHAKMHLRDYVRDDDMDAAIKMMLESFIVAQKFSVRRLLRRNFAKYITSGEDRAHLLLHILGDMMRKEMMYQKISLRRRKMSEDNLILEVPLDELESRARERRIYDILDFCKGPTFQEAGYVLDENQGLIRRSAEVA